MLLTLCLQRRLREVSFSFYRLCQSIFFQVPFATAILDHFLLIPWLLFSIFVITLFVFVSRHPEYVYSSTDSSRSAARIEENIRMAAFNGSMFVTRRPSPLFLSLSLNRPQTVIVFA